MLGHRFRRSTLWLVLFISIVAGLGLARSRLGFISPLLAVPLLVFVYKRTLAALAVLAVFGLALGYWRGAYYMDKLAGYQPLYGRKITLYLRAGEDGAYNKYKQLSFKASGTALGDGRRLAGSIQVSGFGANAIFEGDDIMVQGKLSPGYGPYQGRMSYAQITVLKHNPGLIPQVRRKFAAGVQSALPEPLAPFAMGLLVGQRANLPEGVKDDLLKVGLTHIIAVSGANLTIILHACRRMMGKRSKKATAFISVALLGAFLVLTGASASIVRAAIVSMLSIAAAYYGRSFRPLNLIFLAAVITGWANPVYVWSDLSWHLSFLAFMGVMVLAPLLQARLHRKFFDSVIGGIALESICAEIATLPLVLFVFGQMSRVGLLANILIVALIPFAMLLGAAAGLAGTLAPSVAGWIAWPAVILLNYMLDTAHLLAGLPHVFIEGIGLSMAQMVIIYACIITAMSVLWNKAGKSSIITDMTEQKAGSLLV